MRTRPDPGKSSGDRPAYSRRTFASWNNSVVQKYARPRTRKVFSRQTLALVPHGPIARGPFVGFATGGREQTAVLFTPNGPSPAAFPRNQLRIGKAVKPSQR